MLSASAVQVSSTALHEEHNHHFVQACFTNVSSQKGKFCSDCVATDSGVSFALFNVVLMLRDCYFLSLSQTEAFFCVQTCSSVIDL